TGAVTAPPTPRCWRPPAWIPPPVIAAATVSPSVSDTTPPSPQAEPSALKPISAQTSSRIIDGAPGQSALDGTTTPIEEAPAQQTGTASDTVTQAVAAAPAMPPPHPPIPVPPVKNRGSPSPF